MALALSSCVNLIPERFESNLKFLATYGYVEYNFRGNVLVADAAIEVRNNRASQSETDKMFKEIEQTILDDDKNAMERQFRSLRYIGSNRFSADQQIKSSIVEDLSFFQAENSPFFVEILQTAPPPEDHKYVGDYTIRAFLIDEQMRDKMKQLKVNQRGTFSIETDCRVLSHNAHTVARSGRNYIYTWRVEGKANAPAMLTLRAQQPRLTRF